MSLFKRYYPVLVAVLVAAGNDYEFDAADGSEAASSSNLQV